MGATVGGIVLAGGSGERFGGHKAFAQLGGMSLAARTASLLARATGGGPVVVSLGRGGPTPDDLPAKALLVADEIEAAGPLAGLAASLSALDGKAAVAVICSCDSPLIHPAVLSFLTSHLLESDFEICAPSDAGGKALPFPSVWRTALYTNVAAALSRGERSPSRFAAERKLLQLRQADLLADEEVARNDDKLASLDDVDEREAFETLAASPPRVRVSRGGRLTVQNAWSLSELALALAVEEDAPYTVNGRPIAAREPFALATGDLIAFG